MWVVDSVDVDTRAVNKISKFSQYSEKAAILYVFSLKGHLLNKCGIFYTRIIAKLSQIFVDASSGHWGEEEATSALFVVGRCHPTPQQHHDQHVACCGVVITQPAPAPSTCHLMSSSHMTPLLTTPSVNLGFIVYIESRYSLYISVLPQPSSIWINILLKAVRIQKVTTWMIDSLSKFHASFSGLKEFWISTELCLMKRTKMLQASMKLYF